MSNETDWTPRISVATSEEQFLALQKAIPWGMRDKLFRQFAAELIRISTEHSPTALALLNSHGFHIVMKEKKNE